MTGWFLALAGGALIGLAASIALLFHGRVAGISGIVGGALRRDGGASFRLPFLVGLVATGVAAHWLAPSRIGSLGQTPLMLIVAGLLVGIGTGVSHGCTSGHGVCGISRGSRRSFAAVAIFMATAAITVGVHRAVRG